MRFSLFTALFATGALAAPFGVPTITRDVPALDRREDLTEQQQLKLAQALIALAQPDEVPSNVPGLDRRDDLTEQQKVRLAQALVALALPDDESGVEKRGLREFFRTIFVANDKRDLDDLSKRGIGEFFKFLFNGEEQN